MTGKAEEAKIEARRGRMPTREVLGMDAFTESDAEAVRRAQPPAKSTAFDHETSEAPKSPRR